MFCKHEWKVLSEKTTKSKLDQLNAGGLSNLKANGALILELTSGALLLELTSRKHILTITCEKCGDIKQFVNEI